ncbi:mannose-6-phosphate isomerase, class I [Microbacterium sp. NPDC077184]|uniref:mannose-6-phosphate isomerase, class I n=1 Tax=Microbacterium sp. NPDC077184 TaxID=3154764 RepID=UPI0034378149
MLAPLRNEPRDYAWGSTTLIAELEGREPSGRPEAEVWFGAHPGDPAETPDGRLDEVLGATDAQEQALPYLLKLLAAGSPLSIQAHPSRPQAIEGFAREEAAGIDRDAPTRTYRDANHKPELIVAVSPTFRALAGIRDLDTTRRFIAELGLSAAPLAERLATAVDSLADVIEWVLAPSSDGDTRAVIDAALAATSEEFAAELALVAELEAAYPGDPGIVVAMLMNLVELREGEGLFVPAGVLHAYLSGLGVELMAASDNVLRGGLTPKHIDIDELLSVLDARPSAAPTVAAEAVSAGIVQYPVPVSDFALVRADVAGDDVELPASGDAIALAVAGDVEVSSAGSDAVRLRPGQAVFASADEGPLTLRGTGTVFVATPGR